MAFSGFANAVPRKASKGGSKLSAQCETTGRRGVGADMPFFERYLSLWVALCIVVGILLGRFLPGVFDALGAIEIARM